MYDSRWNLNNRTRWWNLPTPMLLKYQRRMDGKHGLVGGRTKNRPSSMHILVSSLNVTSPWDRNKNRILNFSKNQNGPPPNKLKVQREINQNPVSKQAEKRTILQSRQWRNNRASAHVADRVREGKRGLINEKKKEEEGKTYAAGLVSFGSWANWAHAIAESWPGREISDFTSASNECLKSTKNHRSPVHPARGNGTSWREHRNISSCGERLGRRFTGK